MEPVLPAHVGIRRANPTYKTSLQILVRCAHRSAEQGPLWGCNRVGVRKPAFVPVRRHPATGSHPRARGALYGGGGAPRAVGIRPGRCAWIRLRSSAPTIGSANASPQAGPLLHAAPNHCSAVRGRTSLRFAPCLRRISPLLFVQTLFESSNICAANSEALH